MRSSSPAEASPGGPGRTLRERLPSAGALIPAALVVVMEGAWLAVLYAGIECFWAGGPSHDGPLLLGPVELALFAAVGFVLARGLAPADATQVDPRRQALIPVAFAVLAAAAGWLTAGSALARLTAGNLPAALALHPGGWLAGVAVLRGAAHPSRAHDASVVEAVMRWGIAVLALPWLAASVAPAALRADFLTPGFTATITFVTFGLLALAVTRLDTLGGGAGFDWRTNRSWLLALAVLVLALLVIALPAAFLLGVPVTLALAGVLGPVVFLVDAVISVLALPAGLLAAGLVTLFRALLGPARETPLPSAAPQPPLPTGTEAATGTLYGVFVVLIVAVFAVVAALIIGRWLLGSLGARTRPDESEERAIVVPDRALHLARPAPRLRLPGLARTPTDAVSAYLAALRLFAREPLALRQAHETPAEHARRLRAAGAGSLHYDLLAADYELARYGARRLTPIEHRRAVGRWRRIRDALRRRASD